MTPKTLTHWNTARSKFIEAGGNATQSFGLGRILGQIYALLYMSAKPLCLDEITSELGVSKASVSTTARQLERWGAIKRVWVKGDRRDFYEAETDFRALIRGGFLDTVRKKLDTAGKHIEQIEATLTDMPDGLDSEEQKDFEVISKRLQQAKRFHGKINGLLTNPLLDHLI